MKRLAACATAAALAACGPVVKTVEVSPAEVTLDAVGATAQLRAQALTPDGKPLPVPVRWTSYAPAVVQVDARGRVTALKTGDAQVTADAGGAGGRVQVRVSIPSKAALVPASLELVGVPSAARLALELRDDAGRAVPAREASWSSADERVVRVVGDGALSAVATGKALVTARAGALSASAEVVVRLPEFARIAAGPARLALAVGGKARIEAAAVDGAGKPVGGVPLGFASSNEAVARAAADGTVTALSRGRARIAVFGGGRSAAVDVTVRK
jgi:uncharacterized protein YjdB